MILWENKKALKDLIGSLKTSPHSDFYKNKFSGLPQGSDSPLETLPFLLRNELVDTPPDKRLYVPYNEVLFVGYTSGTTSGKPLVMYFSVIDNYFFQPSLGVPVSRILITYPPLNKNFGASFIQQCHQAKRKVTPVFGDYQNLPNSAVLAKETNVDALYATPTIALKLASEISKFYSPEKFKLLALSSETLTPGQRKELRGLYPKADIANLYGSCEIGQLILFPCKRILAEKKDEFHFLSDAIVALELVEGELVLTYNLNRAFPLVRYKTGDFFEVAQEKCSCGLPGKTVRWSGRMGVDKLKIHGIEIRVEAVEEALGNSSFLSSQGYQIHFYKESEVSEKIRIVVEVKEMGQTNDSILLLIRTELLKNWKVAAGMSLAQALQKEVFSSFDVVFVKEFSLESQKARRLVSHL
ncbi:MAG: hypothetical protein AAB587_02030 [Patescibacteria group bacterium]